MAEFQQSNSFSWGDALFLYIERPGQPLSIACVSVFEGAIPLKDLPRICRVEAAADPALPQHVVFPPFNLGLPSWQFDPNFDIRNHIRQVTLRHGTESDLKALASKIVSTHLDRQRPLWDLTLVRGLGRQSHWSDRAHSSLPGRRSCRGRDGECPDGSEPGSTASAQQDACVSAPAGTRRGSSAAR